MNWLQLSVRPLRRAVDGKGRRLLKIGTAGLDWSALGFEPIEVRCRVEADHRDGEWTELGVTEDPLLHLHPNAVALHYAQAAFEGLKAFPSAADPSEVNLFRPESNAARIGRSAERLLMPAPTTAQFTKACETVVSRNLDYLPAYDTELKGSMYLRPLLFGAGPRLGVAPASSYKFLVTTSPVGKYRGLGHIDALVAERYDRAAPRGVGGVKVAGNYAADLKPSRETVDRGFNMTLYLDAEKRQFVEEFSAANFIGIRDRGTTYVTPSSDSILPSITNESLMTIAKEHGMRVERRPVRVAELEEFEEVGICGTAVAVASVASVTYEGNRIVMPGPPAGNQSVLDVLRKHLQAIQFGEEADLFGWLKRVDTSL